jgi:hypothetical protein
MARFLDLGAIALPYGLFRVDFRLMALYLLFPRYLRSGGVFLFLKELHQKTYKCNPRVSKNVNCAVIAKR